MQDKTINNALLALRRQITREGGDGLNHVEALLRLRDITPPERCRNGKEAKRLAMRWLVIEALTQTDGT
ncbi:MAG: hypothetical protein HKN27_11240, partial [Silicimonas sp.]|nr:hypothetical protein [Silicimonas sp.]